MSDVKTAQLSDLPTEILDRILWFSTPRARKQLHRVNRRFNNLCNAILYKSIRSEQGRQPWRLFDSMSISSNVRIMDETSNIRVGLRRAPRSDFTRLLRSLRENARLCEYVREAVILHVEPFENPVPQMYEFFELVGESLLALCWACTHHRIAFPVMTSLTILQLDYSFVYYSQRSKSRDMKDLDFLQGLTSLHHLSLSDIAPFEREDLENLLHWTPLLLSLRIIYPDKWETQSLTRASAPYIPAELAIPLASCRGTLRDLVIIDRMDIWSVLMPDSQCLAFHVGSFGTLSGLKRLGLRLDWLTCLSDKCQASPPHFRSLPDTVEELHVKLSGEHTLTVAKPSLAVSNGMNSDRGTSDSVFHGVTNPSVFYFISSLVNTRSSFVGAEEDCTVGQEELEHFGF